MKKIISLIITLAILFNVSGEIFAQTFPANKGSVNGSYLLPMPEEYRAQESIMVQELNRHKQEQQNIFNITPERYRKSMEKYAKRKGIDINTIDLSSSYKNYLKQIARYDKDYHALIKVFDGKTYLDVLADAKFFLGNKEKTITYEGKEYDKVALFHAALHNFATREKSGYLYNGTWVFKTGQEADFGIKEKIAVMDFVYKVINNDKFYPKDREVLYQMAFDVVSNGKKFFDTEKYIEDYFPGLSTAETRQAKANDKRDKQIASMAVVQAMSVLTSLSNTSAKKEQSAKVIYELAKDVKLKKLGGVGILGGAKALLALNTDDSLEKLYTLLAEDLYKNSFVVSLEFFFGIFSIPELEKRLANFTNELNSGLGQYYNSIARKYVYIDQYKNAEEQRLLAENRDDSIAYLSNVVYSDIFEEIGKEIGRKMNNPKVAKLAARFADKYYTELSDSKQEIGTSISGVRIENTFKRETKIHASLIVGILDTTKKKNESLTRAAKVIYNGTWWDINEITQRDKNNIAAKYLNLEKKQFNKRKQEMYTLVIRGHNTAELIDIFPQAIILGGLILAVPSIIAAEDLLAEVYAEWFIDTFAI